MSASGGEEIDLSPYVPENAQALADRKPNIREAYDTTPASGSDISGQLSSGTVLELDAGSYTMSSGVSLSGVSGVVGAGADSTTINISGSKGYLFDFNGDTFILEGVTVDISGGDTDAALGSIQYSNECWCEDVVFRGRRDKYGHNGERFTFLVEGTTSSAEGYMHRVQFPDGGTNHPDRDQVGHAIGPNADPRHEGTNVWHECLAANFIDNGFYVAHSPGPNILWNCVARNNASGNIRLGNNDYVVGGYAESTSLPGSRSGKPLSSDVGANIKVVGLEMYGEGDAVGGGSQVIQLRQEVEEIEFEKTVAHNNGGNHLARLDEADVTITDSWWYQENDSSTAVQIGVLNAPANVTADSSWRLRADGADEISGPVTIDGTSYSGTTTAAEAGLGDPQPFPSFHFSGAPSGVGEWAASSGGSGGGSGGPGGGADGVAGWNNMSQTGTAVLDTGACGEVTVEVTGGGFGQMGTAGWQSDDGSVPVRTNFDGMGSIGGGDDYTDTVDESEADRVVTSAEGLQEASQEAEDGETIFIPSTAGGTDSQGLIADGGQPSQTLLQLESGVQFNQNEITIASDRGTNGSGGAVLRLPNSGDSERQSTLIQFNGEACRVTGLILEGPEAGGSGDPDEGPYATGVRLEGAGCEVDNCEIRNFQTTGVHVSPLTAAIHHNSIHNVGQAMRLQQTGGSGGIGGGSGEVECSPAMSE